MPLDLKSTINLPKTDFPMKANLPANEPKILARWEEMGIYGLIREARKGRPVYILHDGPPYANGPIHLGHALNKSLKDFIVKSRTMLGYDAPYIPGWDCHGLPIEIKVDKDLGGKKLKMAPLEVRHACRDYAQKYLDLQRSQFKRIGVFGDWDHPYSTMTPQYEAAVLRVLYRFFEQDACYKGLRSTYWCIHDRTALAEAEVEYENHVSPTVYVKYKLLDEPAKFFGDQFDADLAAKLAGKQVNTIIWTTTPWTLPASMAVTVSPKDNYVALAPAPDSAHAGEVFLVAEALAKEVAEKCSFGDFTTLATFPGTKFEYANFQHPFLDDRKILGVLGNYVTMDTGTGVVHTAPAHGADDFFTGVKYNLDLTCNVDAAGRLQNGLPEYNGKKVPEANPIIIELLRESGALLQSSKIEHSYPHCWRCHNPIIFRSTEQWFIAMDSKMDGDANGTLRSIALDEIKKVKWDPAWGEERITNMIATRPDWCISRQRLWGVPIAVFLCDGCNAPLHDAATNQRVLDLVAQHGVDVWYTDAANAALLEGTKCTKCEGITFRREMDIIDVWFESGSSQAAVLGTSERNPWPADLYLEGGDQYRGWFHSSLLCAVGDRHQSPYRSVATNGWTLDEQGRAQSKSLGNVVDPVDIAERLGGDIVRLWVSSVDFREDVTCSEHLMQRVSDNYRKIRNTFRYILGNLSDFEPSRDSVAYADMESIDRYMLHQTADLADEIQRYYEEFAFHKIYQRIIQFCVVDLSSMYFDVLKDRLYTQAPNAPGRRSAQAAVWRIGTALVKLLAPILSFSCEEVWSYLPKPAGAPASVHLAEFPTNADTLGEGVTADANELFRDWNALLAVREEVMRSLEAARTAKQIGGGLDAQLIITAPELTYPLLARYESQLRYLFIVSEVKLDAAPAGAALSITVTKADGTKCERCWNYSTRVGEDVSYPTACERCVPVLHELEEAASNLAG